MVGPRRSQFHRAVGMNQLAVHRPPGEREILHRPQGVNAPKHVRRDVADAEQVLFFAVVTAHKSASQAMDGARPSGPLGSVQPEQSECPSSADPIGSEASQTPFLAPVVHNERQAQLSQEIASQDNAGPRGAKGKQLHFLDPGNLEFNVVARFLRRVGLAIRTLHFPIIMRLRNTQSPAICPKG